MITPSKPPTTSVLPLFRLPVKKKDILNFNRLLKNGRQSRTLRDSPHPPSLQRAANYASGRLTNSSASQEVAPYSSRRHSQDCLPERQVKGSRGPCVWPFLSDLAKMTFSTAF